MEKFSEEAKLASFVKGELLNPIAIHENDMGNKVQMYDEKDKFAGVHNPRSS